MTGRVLVVTPHADSHARMERLLRKAGFETEHASTFEAARPRLTVTTPDVLISDVHLGEYNGLHLAIVGRDRRPALVAIVVGPPDAVLAREATQHGATYLNEPTTDEALLAKLSMLLQEIGRHRRWPRKHVSETVAAECGASPARIVDLSYGGLRLEVEDGGTSAPQLGSGLRINLPDFGVSIDTALVWVERAPSGYLHCGAAVERLSPALTSAWRQVVDRVGFSVQ
ncbi:MAG TPA: response regulator [Vicinamibacterales bacterium]|nr:response regulator [Vicinamibacterales bacterium]